VKLRFDPAVLLAFAACQGGVLAFLWVAWAWLAWRAVVSSHGGGEGCGPAVSSLPSSFPLFDFGVGAEVKGLAAGKFERVKADGDGAILRVSKGAVVTSR
jgi:hypothetical protein